MGESAIGSIVILEGKIIGEAYEMIRQLKDVTRHAEVSGDNKLREEEKQKIKHAEILFNGAVKVSFKTQFSNTKITELIKEIYNG